MSSVPELVADPLVVETAARLFENDAHAPPEDTAFDAGRWQAIETSGLAAAWVEEALGGGGASLADGLAVARAAGRSALNLPVAETLLASWVLARAGIQVPAGPLTLSADAMPGQPAAGRIDAHLRRMAFARDASHLIFLAGGSIVLVATASADIRPGAALSGEPRDEVVLSNAPVVAAAAVNALDTDTLLHLGALVRGCQMAGALERVLELSLEYAQQREQFGRAISRFQAVQHELAKLAGECAAASAASGAGCSAFIRHGIHDERTACAIAAAKIRVGEAAGAGAAIAHQVHGAMGFSLEYALQRYTRRLWTWRDDFGAESFWAQRLGRRVAAAGAASLWTSITAG